MQLSETCLRITSGRGKWHHIRWEGLTSLATRHVCLQQILCDLLPKVSESTRQLLKCDASHSYDQRTRVMKVMLSYGRLRVIILCVCLIFTENDGPTSLVPDLIDYNMPLTTTYLKQMKLQYMSTNEQVRACT